MKPPILTNGIQWARAWAVSTKPFFDAIYGAPMPNASYPVVVETEPRRWREANKARFDAIYGAREEATCA